MNNQLRVFFLLSSIVPLIAGFQCCNKSCAQDSTEQKPSSTPSQIVQSLGDKSIENTIVSIKTEEEFENLIKKPTIVKFTASWCGACKTIEPLYKKIAQELTEYQFAYIDVDALAGLAEKYKVRGMPTFLFFNNGEQLNGQIIGSGVNHKSFVEKINSIFKR